MTKKRKKKEIPVSFKETGPQNQLNSELWHTYGNKICYVIIVLSSYQVFFYANAKEKFYLGAYEERFAEGLGLEDCFGLFCFRLNILN